MSKVHETKIIPARLASQEQRCIGRTCDLCGRKAKYPASENWDEPSGYEVNETVLNVEVRQKEGYSCPDGGNGTKYEVDLCPACFKDRLVP